MEEDQRDRERERDSSNGTRQDSDHRENRRDLNIDNGGRETTDREEAGARLKKQRNIETNHFRLILLGH